MKRRYQTRGLPKPEAPEELEPLPLAEGEAIETDADLDEVELGFEEAGFDESGASRSYRVPDEAASERLDRFLVKATEGAELSRTRLKSLIEEGAVLVDGTAASASTKLRPGSIVGIVMPEPVDPIPHGEDIPLTIVFEDEHLLVIDKPAGIVVHPAAGHPTGTLVNALIHHCGDSLSGIGGVRRPGIVHRLDKDTSGLLVVAKSNAAHRGLAKLFADHGRELSLERAYHALVWNVPERTSGTVEAALGRHATDRQRMAVVADARGRFAITHWERLETYDAPEKAQPVASLVACMLETGRTHQIRVHMAHIGHPVMGDPLYAKGFKTKEAHLGTEARALLGSLGRQALHASILGFEHPVTHEEMHFESELPDDLEALRLALGGRVLTDDE